MNRQASITALMSSFGRAFHTENEVHASTGVDVGLSQVHELLCGGKSAAIRAYACGCESKALPGFRLCNGSVIRAFFRVGWRKASLTERLRNKREYRITTTVPDAKTQSRTCESKLPCVFLAPERTFYEFFEIYFWEERAMDRI